MSDWEREYRWARLEATGTVTCPQCGDEIQHMKKLRTPFRTSVIAKMVVEEYGEEIIDVPSCHCRKLSEEDRARLKADRLFTAALKQSRLTYVALADHTREQSGIIGYVVAQDISTPEQIMTVIDTVEQALEHALQAMKGNTTMSDGFSNEGMPTTELSAKDIMSQLGSSNADGFNVPITTSDVKAGFGNIETVTLQASDGSAIFCEHHDIGVLNVSMPTQDVPPGETQARP